MCEMEGGSMCLMSPITVPFVVIVIDFINGMYSDEMAVVCELRRWSPL